jgi:hypothetical protein
MPNEQPAMGAGLASLAIQMTLLTTLMKKGILTMAESEEIYRRALQQLQANQGTSPTSLANASACVYVEQMLKAFETRTH